jgi:hypothetical protein
MRSRMNGIFMICIVGILGVQLALFSGCASDSTAGKEAGRGAVLGGVGGAVAGGVSSLIFGGNVAGGIAAGAAIGAASGAATGAVSGAMSDSERKKAEEKAKAGTPPEKPDSSIALDPRSAELEKEFGKKNFEAATLLAKCRHREAIGAAEEAYASAKETKLRVYALYIKAISAEESGNKDLAQSIYPKIVQEDAQRGNVDKVRGDTLEGVLKIQKIRQEHGAAPFCK